MVAHGFDTAAAPQPIAVSSLGGAAPHRVLQRYDEQD